MSAAAAEKAYEAITEAIDEIVDDTASLTLEESIDVADYARQYLVERVALMRQDLERMAVA